MQVRNGGSDSSGSRLSGVLLPALAIGAIFLAAVLITPAIGGPSVKKLAKKVSKALELAEEANQKAQQALEQSGRPGPQGEQGGQGPQGLQGPAALMLNFGRAVAGDASDLEYQTLGTQNELTVEARCHVTGADITVDVALTSSVGARISYMVSAAGNGSPTGAVTHGETQLPAGSRTVVWSATTSGTFQATKEIQAVYHHLGTTTGTPARVISLDLHVITTEITGGECEVIGTAVPASR